MRSHINIKFLDNNNKKEEKGKGEGEEGEEEGEKEKGWFYYAGFMTINWSWEVIDPLYGHMFLSFL